MQVELLSNVNDIEGEWWDLWSRDPAATPFQSPAWLLPWRRNFPDGDNIVLTLRDRGRLMALVPFFRHEGRLLLWGAGTTDWLDGTFDPELDLAALSRAVGKLPLPVDLFQLSVSSPLIHMQGPEGWREHVGTAESCAVLPLPTHFSTRLAQNLRYYRRRAERAGVAEPEEGGLEDFDALVDLHTRRWSRQDQPGIFADPRMIGWQKEALSALAEAGQLRFYVLRLHGRTIAALCVLCARQRSFYYIGGFDPQYSALGLGTILVGCAVTEAQQEQHRSFDFLRGREPYKYRWGAVDQTTHARHLTPPGWKGAHA